MDEITEQLWISDISDAQTEDKSQFDRVITTCQTNIRDNVGCAYDHFNLADGEGDWVAGECSYDVFSDAASTILDALRNDEVVLVHCHAGQSRSVSTSLAALTVYYDELIHETYNRIESQRPQVNPNNDLCDFAVQFVSEHENGAVATVFTPRHL